MSSKLDIRITADNKDASRAFKDTQGDISALDRSIGKMNKSLSSARGNLGKGLKVAGIGAAVGIGALTVAGAGATKIVSSLISAGSDVEEMMGKFNVVFADGAGTTEELTSNLDAFAKLVGRNKYDLRGYAATFGDTFKPMGFATDEAAALSETMTQLTVDLASFNNMTEDEVAERLASTLIGNHGNVLKFGVIINEATLKQELMRMGMEDLTGAALEQAKAQARLNLIIAGTQDAQGDAIRTGGSWANQMRKLQGIFAQTKADLGVKLLPVFTPILTEVAALADTHLPALTDAFAAWVGSVDVDKLSENLEGFFAGLTAQVESLAAGEGLKVDLISLVGLDTAGLTIPVTFKRAGLVFESPLADLGLNQAGNLEIDLDFSMQGDEKIAWGDVFSFERNVKLGTSDIKIAWGDVFEFERDATFKPVITKIKFTDMFELEGKRNIGEFFEITALKIGGFDLSNAAKVSWSDIFNADSDSAFIQDMLTIDLPDAPEWLTGFAWPADPMGDWDWPGDPMSTWAWPEIKTPAWWGSMPKPGWWDRLTARIDWGGGGGSSGVDGGSNADRAAHLGNDRPGVLGTNIGEIPRPTADYPGNAAGTNFWRGGPTWVGERGPEIVNLPRGAQVIPNHQATAPTINISATVASHIDIEVLANRIAEITQRRGAMAF